MEKPQFVYVTYIRTTPQKVWDAVTRPEFTRQYWGDKSNFSDWRQGSKWKHMGADEDVWMCGEVLETDPPKRLVLSWADPDDLADSSQVCFEIEPIEDMVRLRVTHGNFREGSVRLGNITYGWPLVLSSMKSYLETGAGINIWAKAPTDAAPCARTAAA